jgi:hypothetical protein
MFRTLAAIAAPFLFASTLLPASTAFAQSGIQTQFSSNAPVGAASFTFNRYNGPDILTKAEFRAQAAVTFKFQADELLGSGIPWNLYSSVSNFGFPSLDGAPIDYFTGPTLAQTTPASGSVFATYTYDLGEVLTTYTNPAFLNAFFVGPSTFSYTTGGTLSGFVDSFLFSIIPFRSPDITVTAGVTLIYHTTPIPEPTTLALLAAPVALLLRRRRR